MNEHSSKAGVWLYYLLFVFFVVLESSIVEGILRLARWMGIAGFGPWLAWILFASGGTTWSLVELRLTHVGQKMRDPFLMLACWLQRRLKAVGFCITSLIMGPPAAAIAIKQAGTPYKEGLSVVSSILFASLWVPLYILIWRQIGG